MAEILIRNNTVFMGWPNNETGHWNIFFERALKFKAMIISAPKNGDFLDQDKQNSASGTYIYVTRWTSKPGMLMPESKASNDNRETFGKIMILNKCELKMSLS